MNAVIYARFSSHTQQEQSIDGQLRVCKEYAKKHGYTVINEYVDRALTGRTDRRPGFLQMIEDAKSKNFQYILVYKLDRFSRNHYDSVIYKYQLKQSGVQVISATEAISNTDEGFLIEGLLEMMAEMYSRDLSQKVKRGIKESILKGNFIGGNILYGYKVENKKILIDENTAPAIRYLFNEYANGKSKKQIIKELNEKGFRTNTGKPLSYNSFQNNLKNIKYTGIFDNGELQNAEYYPAIINKDLFNRVQARLNEHKHAPATQKAKEEYLLTGKAFCGHCGANLVGVSGTSRHGTKHYYYTCSKRWREHACDKKNEHKNELEDFVIEQTLNFVLTPEHIENIANGMLEVWNNNTIQVKIKEYEKQINKLDRELDKCFDIFYNANNEELQKRMNEKADSITIQKQDLQNELQKLKLSKVITRTKEDVKNLLAEYLDGNKDDINYKRKIINQFVNSVYVFDDKTIIYYNVFGNDKMTFEEMQENLKENGVLILNTPPRH